MNSTRRSRALRAALRSASRAAHSPVARFARSISGCVHVVALFGLAGSALRCCPAALRRRARDDLDAFTKGLKGLDGQFAQQVFDANGKLKETSSGTRRAVGAAPVPLGIR